MASADEVSVLYVDDEPEFADLVEYWLTHDDGSPELSVTLANGVEEALDVLATESIDCIVSDYDMPERDGLDFLDALRERHSALPFVLFTARGGEEIARDAFRAGVTDYMAKEGDPETIGLLAERVRNAVAQRRSAEGGGDDHLQYRSGMRDIALDAATNLMSATPDELDTKVSFTLETVCDFMDIGRSATYLSEGPDEESNYERSHSLLDEEEQEEQQQELLPETLDANGDHEEWLDRLARFQTVQYGSPGTHPSADERVGPEDRSGVVAPMLSSEFRLIGLTVFDDPEGRVWSDEEVTLLETVTELITRAVERRRQQRELRRQNDRLEQFASTVSHDLRNPIAVADGWIDMAKQGNPEGFEKVQDSLDRMQQLIDDVLTLARDGSDIGDTEPVQIESVAEEAWTRVNTREAELTMEPVGEIEADEGRLASVFENLFRNAVEHGGKAVEIEVGPIPDGGFYVADDGPGLPDGGTEELFDWGKTTESSGSGLGLAIVSTVAEAHGWTVEATESGHGGARFEFLTE
jgi:signal transduction histidine kinase/DNA-binding response OmpR family regulator